MIYFKKFENFNSIETKVLDNKDFTKLALKDPTIEKRIRFLHNSYGYFVSENNPYFIVAFADNKIVGVSKIGHYKNGAKNENDYSVTFLSIDRNYRGQKISRLLVNEIFKFAKDMGLSIRATCYSMAGLLKLKPLMNEYAKKYDVEFRDTDEKLDVMWFYNDDLIHQDEMTDKELEEHKKKKS